VLKRHKYPPENRDEAVALIILQTEALVEEALRCADATRPEPVRMVAAHKGFEPVISRLARTPCCVRHTGCAVSSRAGIPRKLEMTV